MNIKMNEELIERTDGGWDEDLLQLFEEMKR